MATVQVGALGMRQTHQAIYYPDERIGYVKLHVGSPAESTEWKDGCVALSTFKRWARAQIREVVQ